MKISCKYVVIKTCPECDREFADNKWCGLFMCNRCLNMAWIIDDDEIIKKVFECCDSHRPHVGQHSMPHLFVNTLDTNNTNNTNNIERHFVRSSQPIKIIKSENDDECSDVDSKSCPSLIANENLNNVVVEGGYSLNDDDDDREHSSSYFKRLFKKLSFQK